MHLVQRVANRWRLGSLSFFHSLPLCHKEHEISVSKEGGRMCKRDCLKNKRNIDFWICCDCLKILFSLISHFGVTIGTFFDSISK